MPDAHALPRLLDELVWSLRRAGFHVAPSQVVDLERSVAALGWGDRVAVSQATAAIVAQRASEQVRVLAAFEEFFARPAPPQDLWERLRARGFADDELTALRLLLDGLARDALDEGGARFHALLEGGTEVERLLRLAGFRRELADLRSPLQVGFFTQRATRLLGLHDAHVRLATLRQHLRGALGARGDALADALARELDERRDAVRDHVRASLPQAREDKGPRALQRRDELPFTSLTDSEMAEVRRAVRSFADRLRGAARVRARRALRGRIDPGRTIRALLRTGGVPFHPIRRRRRRNKPRILLLCDVSESVRTASRFMLELVYAAHELFARTRSFVFVSELGETTALFEDQPAEVALAAAYDGGVVPVTDNSNYGRVLRAFDARAMASVDHRTTVVILGDGRTNYHDASEDVLGKIRTRARALYWFSTEPRAAWSTGDSAMHRYAPHCTAVLEVTTARGLEEAARTLVQRR